MTPLCEVCGAIGEDVTVTGQVELGQPPHSGVTEQTYLFQPCGHTNTADIADPAGM